LRRHDGFPTQETADVARRRFPPVIREPSDSPQQPASDADEDFAADETGAETRAHHHRRRRILRPLSLSVRVTLHILGWLLTVIGVAGFFLPVLPGGLALAAGLALLSVASRRLHLWLRPKFRRWPRAWRRLERFRRRLHRRLEPPE
jgi:hypothetical protein